MALNVAGADFRTPKLPLTSILLFSLEFALSTLKTGVEMIILADYFYLNIKLLNSWISSNISWGVAYVALFVPTWSTNFWAFQMWRYKNFHEESTF